MKRFSAKKLGYIGSFGEILRQARKRHGWSLSQISFNLKIPERYLAALEQEALSDLPAGLYGYKFLREYANFLDLSPIPLLAEYQDRLSSFSSNKISSKLHQRRPFFGWFSVSPLKLFLSLLCLILLIYLSWEAVRLFLPPPLVILNPPTNVTTQNLDVTIIGKTLPGVKVTLNGEMVAVDNEGFFHQIVALQPGLNTIEVSAVRSYSQPVKISRQVLLVPTLPQNPTP